MLTDLLSVSCSATFLCLLSRGGTSHSELVSMTAISNISYRFNLSTFNSRYSSSIESPPSQLRVGLGQAQKSASTVTAYGTVEGKKKKKLKQIIIIIMIMIKERQQIENRKKTRRDSLSKERTLLVFKRSTQTIRHGSTKLYLEVMFKK